MTVADPGPRDPIRDALAALPRTGASADFADRLEARLAAEAPRRRRRRAIRLRLAAAAGLVLALAGAGLLEERRQRIEARDRRQALHQRHDQLRRELAELRLRAATPPTLYLGATDDFDVVLDLGPWLEPGSQAGTQPGHQPGHQPRPQPASHADSRPRRPGDR